MFSCSVQDCSLFSRERSCLRRFASETPTLFCSPPTGRETDPALPPQTPFSPSFPATASPFSVALLRESRRMNPRGICLRLAPPGLEGGREIKRPATRLENHLGLNSCSPLAARWLGRQRESPRVRAAPPRLPRDARTRSTTAASEAPHDCGVLSQRTLGQLL